MASIEQEAAAEEGHRRHEHKKDKAKKKKSKKRRREEGKEEGNGEPAAGGRPPAVADSDEAEGSSPRSKKDKKDKKDKNDKKKKKKKRQRREEEEAEGKTGTRRQPPAPQSAAAVAPEDDHATPTTAAGLTGFSAAARARFPELTPGQWAQLEQLGALVQEWNGKVNVISRKDIVNVLPRHVLPCMGIAKLLARAPEGTRLMDVGTGGGFPGLPLAICCPKVRFLLVDSIRKKINVVSDMARRLGLANVEARHTRVEEVREKFHFITGRSVTAMPRFVGWVQGKFVWEALAASAALPGVETGAGGGDGEGIRGGILYIKGGVGEDVKDQAGIGVGLGCGLALPCPITRPPHPAPQTKPTNPNKTRWRTWAGGCPRGGTPSRSSSAGGPGSTRGTRMCCTSTWRVCGGGPRTPPPTRRRRGRSSTAGAGRARREAEA